MLLSLALWMAISKCGWERVFLALHVCAVDVPALLACLAIFIGALRTPALAAQQPSICVRLVMYLHVRERTQRKFATELAR